MDGQNYVYSQTWARALSLAAGTTYYPTVAGDIGLLLGGLTGISIEALLATTGAGDSITLTVETTNDGAATPAAASWIPSSPSVYDVGNCTTGLTSWVASGATGTTSVELDLDKISKLRVRVKIVVVKAVNNSMLSLFVVGR